MLPQSFIGNITNFFFRQILQIVIFFCSFHFQTVFVSVNEKLSLFFVDILIFKIRTLIKLD